MVPLCTMTSPAPRSVREPSSSSRTLRSSLHLLSVCRAIAAPPRHDSLLLCSPTLRESQKVGELVRCKEKEIGSILAHPLRPDSESPPLFCRLGKRSSLPYRHATAINPVSRRPPRRSGGAPRA